MNSENIIHEISLKDLIIKINQWYLYLKTKWIALAMAGLIGILAGYFYAARKKPDYIAVSTFVLEDSNSSGSMGQYAGLASIVGIDLGASSSNGIFQGDNIIELYRSRTMLQKTLLSEEIFNQKKQLLIERYIDFNNLKEKWAQNPALLNLNFRNRNNKVYSRLQDSLLGDVINEINNKNLLVTKPDKKLSIIKVQLTSNDELFAKAFNNMIVKNVNDFYVQTKTKKSLKNVSVLQRQTDSVRRELNSAISGMASSIDANPNANPSRQILRVPSQRRQIDAEANKAILTELVKNLELSKITLQKEMPLIQLIDVPVSPLTRTAASKTKMMIIGGFLSVFLIVVILIIKRGLKSILH